MYSRWTYTPTGDNKIIICAHTSNRLDNFALIISYNFDTFKLDAEREAPFCKEGGICVDRL